MDTDYGNTFVLFSIWTIGWQPLLEHDHIWHPARLLSTCKTCKHFLMHEWWHKSCLAYFYFRFDAHETGFTAVSTNLTQSHLSTKFHRSSTLDFWPRRLHWSDQPRASDGRARLKVESRNNHRYLQFPASGCVLEDVVLTDGEWKGSTRAGEIPKRAGLCANVGWIRWQRDGQLGVRSERPPESCPKLQSDLTNSHVNFQQRAVAPKLIVTTWHMPIWRFTPSLPLRFKIHYRTLRTEMEHETQTGQLKGQLTMLILFDRCNG